MRVKKTGIDPRKLIDQALRDAGTALDKASGGKAVLTDSARAQLSPTLQKVADSFDGAVTKDALLGQLQSRLEGFLEKSLDKGALIQSEVEGVLDALEFSGVGVQARQLIAAAKEPAGIAAIEQMVTGLLTTADATAGSQIQLFGALQQAADAHKADSPRSAVAKFLGQAVKDRGKWMRKSVTATLKDAEKAHKKAGSDETLTALQGAMQAAVDVHQATAPTGSRLKQLRKKQGDIGQAAPLTAQTQPFFARFLEQQTTQGEAPMVQEGDKPGNYVTLKFPSDNEDGGSDGGDVAVTRKFPSDNEDGGVDEGGGITTAKFPSDNEDGGGGPGGPGGVMVTMKFPSDNEDGGHGGAELLPELRPELIVELAPELIPELQPELIAEIAPELIPELRPELIVELAPELNPDPVDEARQRKMARTEQAVCKALFAGTDHIRGRIDEINGLLRGSRMNEGAKYDLSREMKTLTVILGGDEALTERIKELTRMPTVALMTEEGMKDLQAEIAMHKSLQKDLGLLRSSFEALSRRRHHSPAEYAQMAVLKRTHAMGSEGLEARLKEIDSMLASPALQMSELQLKLERAGIEGMLSGGPAMADRMDKIDSMLINGGMDPATAQLVEGERALLKGLYNDLHQLQVRADEIDARWDNPEIAPELIVELAPELIPELRPEMIVEIAPEMIPELNPEMIVEVAPELIPELRPEMIVEIAPEVMPDPVDQTRGRRAVVIEHAIVKGAYHGGDHMRGQLKDIENTLRTARLSQPMYTQLTQQAEAIKTFLAGGPAIEDKLKELRRLPTVALMTDEGMKDLQAQIGMYEMLLIDSSHLKKTTDSLARRRHRTPSEEIELGVVKAAWHGYDMVDTRIAEIDDLLTRATFDEAGLKKIKLERNMLSLWAGGNPAMTERYEEILQLLQAGLLSPEALADITLERSVLKALAQHMGEFGTRAKALSDKLENLPEVAPELIVELAPELIPELRPEMIVELAPELIPELRPEMIVEIAPEMRPLDDDDD